MNLFFINFKHLSNEDFLYLGISCKGNFGDGEYIAHRQTQVWNLVAIDQITIKTPNREGRLYWCLIEFIDLRCNQTCWYFRPLL
jgi:hypothetical protein